MGEKPLRIGISSCLLGESVRFDGGHKKDRYLTDILGAYVEWVPVCPELEAGMGVPREAVRLVGAADHPRMIGTKSGEDWTERMTRVSADRARQLGEGGVHGFIFKSDSPSCGLERVRVYSHSGMPSKNGRGIFAAEFTKRFPLIPAEEEGRLNDPGIRENFIVRIFAYRRLVELFGDGFRRGALVGFHARHKYLLLAHSPKHYAMLGKLVARAKEVRPGEMREAYGKLFMEALGVRSTVRKNVNVLHHILGFLRKRLTAAERMNILSVIEEYHAGIVPLVVPLTLVQHYVRVCDVPYIKDQLYLDPHPKELALRNHA